MEFLLYFLWKSSVKLWSDFFETLSTQTNTSPLVLIILEKKFLILLQGSNNWSVNAAHWVQKCSFPSTRFKGSGNLSRLSCLTGGKEKNYAAEVNHTEATGKHKALRRTRYKARSCLHPQAVQIGWIFLLAFSYTGTSPCSSKNPNQFNLC